MITAEAVTGQRAFPPATLALEHRMARTQGSRADVTGPLIRTHARRLFARQGFAAVSMRQIASAVGVQAGALYAYTPDKQALLFDLLEAHMQELLGAWTDVPGDPLAMRLDDPRLATMALIAMLTGVTNWYREGGRLDRRRIGDIYWGLARGAVGAH